MNLDKFLALERQRLLEERQRLAAADPVDGGVTFGRPTAVIDEEIANEAQESNVKRLPENAITLNASNNNNKPENENALNPKKLLLPVESTKTAKEAENSNRQHTEAVGTRPHKSKREHGSDHTDAWVTDTFYSYFPGFTDEYQKRQHCLHERQLRNQENYLKHASQVAAAAIKDKENIRQKAKANASNSINDSSNITLRSTVTGKSPRSQYDKSEQEIIVTNPNYAPTNTSRSLGDSTRPGSTRHKLLQDLRHIELSQIVAGDGVDERNRRGVLMELARKKNYQQDLVQQIEEKRRSIELLRDKERHQEEALTKRLQKQLHTLQLEEQVEKEKMYVDRVRYDSENNRLMRERLLAKLERDAAMVAPTHPIPASQQESPEKYTRSHDEPNNVYRYFSNSARREYRRGQPLPEAVELDLDLSALTDHEVEHLQSCASVVVQNTTNNTNNDRKCPKCKTKLRNYNSICLCCQKQKHSSTPIERDIISLSHKRGSRSFQLVCENCERSYTMCSNCLEQSEVCEACHCKRNICLNCRRALCAVCLDVMQRDDDSFENSSIQDDSRPRMSINASLHPDSISSQDEAKFPKRPIQRNDASPSGSHPAYSMNIERDSVFHPDYDLHETPNKISPHQAVLELPLRAHNPLEIVDSLTNLERMRTEADKRLQNYFNNYGDLALMHSRSTQTTPDSVARRDVVLREDHNLSMPLLREMPRLTREDGVSPLAGDQNTQLHHDRQMSDLQARWEIPAVQKQSISHTTPKILTQLGAVRKQLQAYEMW